MRRRAFTVNLLLMALLPWLAMAVPAIAQSDGATDPGSTGPWKLPGRNGENDKGHHDERWSSQVGKLQSIRGQIHEVEELGRLLIEDASDKSQYWIQLPDSVKIRAADRSHFGGRKKLELKDLEVGQRIVLTLRRSDSEILKLVIRRPSSESAQPASDP